MNFSFYNNLMLWFSIIWTVLMQFVYPTAAAAASYRGRYREPKCKDTQTGRELFIGDAYTRLGKCVRAQCLADLTIWEDRCQVPQLSDNCIPIPPANQYLDYPKCCPIYECRRREVSDDGETEEINTYDHYGNLKKTRIRQLLLVPRGSAQPNTGGVRAQFNI